MGPVMWLSAPVRVEPASSVSHDSVLYIPIPADHGGHGAWRRAAPFVDTKPSRSTRIQVGARIRQFAGQSMRLIRIRCRRSSRQRCNGRYKIGLYRRSHSRGQAQGTRRANSIPWYDFPARCSSRACIFSSRLGRKATPHTDADEPATLQTHPARRPVLVWDAPPVRLFHWLVVVLVTGPGCAHPGGRRGALQCKRRLAATRWYPPAQPEPASGIATKRIFR
jgi:hypothetical protein